MIGLKTTMHPLCTHIFPQINKYNVPMNVNLPLLCVATLIPVSHPVNIFSIDSHPNTFWERPRSSTGRKGIIALTPAEQDNRIRFQRSF